MAISEWGISQIFTESQKVEIAQRLPVAKNALFTLEIFRAERIGAVTHNRKRAAE